MKQAPLSRISDLEQYREQLTQMRRHIHQRPELSFEEEETAKFVAEKLKNWGFSVTCNVGGHGVIGTLSIGDSRRVLGVRADMDALPIQETGELSYASIHRGKMHACGHDGHTTILLGAAQHLAKTRNFDGTVHLIFQPAEEADKDTGAQRMLADGLFERFPCDAIFGLHNHPGIPAGSFAFRSGAFLAACDTVRLRIIGKGGHAARPHLTVDPIVVASTLVTALQTIVSRNIDPNDAAVVTVSVFQAGTVNNVIPEEAYLEISVRTFSPDVRSLIEQRIRAMVSAHAQSAGAKAELEYVHGIPALVNTNAETELAREVARELVGPDCVFENFPLQFGSEDFAFYLQQKPGCFLRLGNGENRALLHNSRYDFNDDILTVGSAFWTRLVETYLKLESV